jgi:sirohydrochlorin ferrochelatase
MPDSTAPRLLVVAHGTRSAAGSATTSALVAALAAARPGLRVDLCFLDVAAPTLREALAADAGQTVAVPLLLSTGFHVQHDIPAAAAGHANVTVAQHLGPHPLLIDALVDRLGGDGPRPVASTLLVGAGSSLPEAADELATTAGLLAARLDRPVSVATMADDLRGVIASLPAPVDVATYLLTDGQFTSSLHTAADGRAWVAPAIGVHPALVELVLVRFDAAALQR